MSDKINHPRHYTAGSIEVYDFIDAWNLDFTIGNVVKYVTRAPYKGTQLEDLKKAKWYLEKAIEKEQARIAERVTSTLAGDSSNEEYTFRTFRDSANQFVVKKFSQQYLDMLKREEEKKNNKPG